MCPLLKYINFSFAILIIGLLSSCAPTKDKAIGVIVENAMVVTAREEASNIGIEILKNGGNAWDAMMATELALAVSYPNAGNIGGGGFMVYRTNEGEIGALDYREKAPKKAYRDMYLDSSGNVIPNKSINGAMAVGVPGTIAGIFEAHRKFGKLSVKEIIQPVIDLANRGVVVTEKEAERIAKYQEIFGKINKDSILLQNNWKAGDTIKYKALAKTLVRIQKNGEDEFYKGETAKILTKFIQDNGGIINHEDLSSYKPVWRKPVSFNYDNLRIISMSPPSSGGITLAQIFNTIEPYDLQKYGHNSVKAIQVITEAERRAYADRNFFLGDPDFVSIPTKQMMSKDYAKNRMQNFSFKKATPSSEVAHGVIEIIESTETTHYSIVDQYGNAVAVTTTLNGNYGSKLYSNELGFFLNNEMDDFSSKPGVPNMFGLIGAKANEIQPEKRMLSSMSPTIVEKDGKLFMVVGTPGGSTIITSVLQTILNVHEYGMPMQEAINQPRFHHQWLPDEVIFEPNGFSSKILDTLKGKGYNVKEQETLILGKVEGILVLPDGRLEGGADRRGDDKAVGF
ncbi:gamma-glutamyltranspeptidase/glutathione hydrolase [Balneicella halophila]|uniref:Glutathione hydrolase proenzyme n=1 Tax=Balneicella halophila TaxID=1537566 RepID=A0A7L4UQN3_BALHA|nr:gamma-glutamyltransferase [Balneicella halophila]PVX51822.1 gamma-glutamyltranspeptidase/glutathione hydrolase [Balneicella halophila]